MSPDPLEVRSGRVILQRLIDIADAIDLRHIRARPASAAGGHAPRLTAGLPAVAIDLGTVALAGVGIEGRAMARIYDFGVVALALTCEVVHLEWDAVLAQVEPLAPETLPDPVVRAWDTITHRLLATTGLAFRDGEGLPLAEQHLIVEVDAFAASPEVSSLPTQLDLPRFLAGDPFPLSARTRQHLLRHCFSHHADDLVALGRLRSFVYRPGSTPGMAEVLEAAHARLLELRYYDALLDAELPRMYALVARSRRRFDLLAPRRMANLARRLYTLVAEVSELTGRLDASMQLAGSTHLARAYTAALELLQVEPLNQAVDRKLAIVRDTYAALYDEAAASRAGLLEVIIIALISLEILLALLR
ncbi:hypothetical protein [Frateuria terrea]|uniref:DUF155 domain-containing protein n=1 Tax=Frateuria terrea TaxID=529704 RepID=A0A1H6UQP1_9GAMM|nr:hypothetical protein [Frateuria terrea]SEI94006.1 hypothetical protein SAMN04487997_2103 [Frateuria terrea]SFP34377.1 hypothetical protein SAMN02927913_1624 [Frateuria terrea]